MPADRTELIIQTIFMQYKINHTLTYSKDTTQLKPLITSASNRKFALHVLCTTHYYRMYHTSLICVHKCNDVLCMNRISIVCLQTIFLVLCHSLADNGDLSNYSRDCMQGGGYWVPYKNYDFINCFNSYKQGRQHNNKAHISIDLMYHLNPMILGLKHVQTFIESYKPYCVH